MEQNNDRYYQQILLNSERKWLYLFIEVTVVQFSSEAVRMKTQWSLTEVCELSNLWFSYFLKLFSIE